MRGPKHRELQDSDGHSGWGGEDFQAHPAREGGGPGIVGDIPVHGVVRLVAKHFPSLAVTSGEDAVAIRAREDASPGVEPLVGEDGASG